MHTLWDFLWYNQRLGFSNQTLGELHGVFCSTLQPDVKAADAGTCVWEEGQSSWPAIMNLKHLFELFQINHGLIDDPPQLCQKLSVWFSTEDHVTPSSIVQRQNGC